MASLKSGGVDKLNLAWAYIELLITENSRLHQTIGKVDRLCGDILADCSREVYEANMNDLTEDLLSGRKPFNKTAEILFSRADNKKVKIYVSSLSFSNIDYVLGSHYAATHSRQLIGKLETLVTVLPVDGKTIDLAIASDFNDSEDAIQYSCAIENNLKLS